MMPGSARISRDNATGIKMPRDIWGVIFLAARPTPMCPKNI
jgi:hypothetical protein